MVSTQKELDNLREGYRSNVTEIFQFFRRIANKKIIAEDIYHKEIGALIDEINEKNKIWSEIAEKKELEYLCLSENPKDYLI